MYTIVTGASGFIGSNLVKALNERGENNIIAVDNLKHADKFKNLVDCDIADYLDKADFLRKLQEGFFDGLITAVLHQGACSDTMETDGRYMMENNYHYSLELLNYCQNEEVPFLYASSASVYGSGNVFKESREYEAPLNVYGYSKFLFDQIVRRRWHHGEVFIQRGPASFGSRSVSWHVNTVPIWNYTEKLNEICDLVIEGEVVDWHLC